MNRQGDLRTGIDCAAAWKLSTTKPSTPRNAHRAAALRDWSYESRSLFRRLETRLFHYGLVPLGSEGT